MAEFFFRSLALVVLPFRFTVKAIVFYMLLNKEADRTFLHSCFGFSLVVARSK